MPALEIGSDERYEPGTPNAAFAVDTESVAKTVGRQVESLALDELASIRDSTAFEVVVVGEDFVHKRTCEVPERQRSGMFARQVPKPRTSSYGQHSNPVHWSPVDAMRQTRTGGRRD
jgi:hypothetical protein